MDRRVRRAGRRLRKLRRSARPRCLFHELNALTFDELFPMDEQDQHLQRAINTIAQSDPLIKLLQQVRLGRMKPNDAGLRAVTESWLGVYAQVLKSHSLSRSQLVRLDPEPRLGVLVEAGVLSWDHAGTKDLRALFQQMVVAAIA